MARTPDNEISPSPPTEGHSILRPLAAPPSDVAQTAPPVRLSRQPDEPPERAYLLVIEEQSAVPFELPIDGDVIIGRAPDATLRLADPSASRYHAQISMHDGEALACDRDSRNGTRVNGERIKGARRLHHGDVVSICEALLIFSRKSPTSRERPVLTLDHLRQRLEEELDRSSRYQRPVSVLCLRFADNVERAAVSTALQGTLRAMDVLAWGRDAELYFIFPELSGPEITGTARRLTESLAGKGLRCQSGYATCPDDGSDVDTLLSGAQAAATAASSGPPLTASETKTTLQVGEHRILLVDATMVRLYALIEKLAASDLPVLIQGETGVGKELAAAALHHFSKRQSKPFLSVNCAALPENLVESELFGHERGAFTGAVSTKLGYLEAASGGTLFLDEIGELPTGTQAKLLRALETQRITRVGEVKERTIDLRIIAATNRDLKQDSESGRFRKDLFFRLGSARLMLPSLRERRREIPVLARAFLNAACARLERPALEISPAAMLRIQGYAWPGNVRELKNVMDYAAATADGPLLMPWHIEEQVPESAKPAAEEKAAAAPSAFGSLEEELRDLERRRMAEALAACDGVQTRAAELIGMPMRTFTMKVKQFKLATRKES